MLRTEWGNPFGHCHLLTRCGQAHKVAQEVFAPWQNSNTSRDLGSWSIEREGQLWRVNSPPAMHEFLLKLEVPSVFEQVEEAVKAVEFQAVAASIQAPRAPLGFHGALLRNGGTGLGLIGGKEAGKSTLAAALYQNGWELFSDDSFQLSEQNEAFAMCRRCRLRAGSRPLLGKEFWQELSHRAASFEQPDGGLAYYPAQIGGQGVALTHLVLLDKEPSELKALEESDLMLRCVVHCHTYHTEGLPQSLAKLGPLSNSLKGYELGRGPIEEQVRALGSLVS